MKRNQLLAALSTGLIFIAPFIIIFLFFSVPSGWKFSKWNFDLARYIYIIWLVPTLLVTIPIWILTKKYILKLEGQLLLIVIGGILWGLLVFEYYKGGVEVAQYARLVAVLVVFGIINELALWMIYQVNLKTLTPKSLQLKTEK